MTKIGIISLGCPRNLVDSEVMMGLLKEKGYRLVEDIGRSDVAIVNTCAFIEDAKRESIDTIFELIELKKIKRIRHIVVAGCLVQRYKEGLDGEFKEIDGFIGTGDLVRIDSLIGDILAKKRSSIISEKPEYLYDHETPRDFITPPHYAYVKVQEGCANRCSFCVIPQIRGDLRSRPIESILKEVDELSRKRKISELNIVGQDTTHYGYELYGRSRLAELLKSIARRRRIGWIRLLYTHPAHYTDELIKTIRDEGSICKYLDLPIQHISDRILKRMKRNTTAYSICSLIEKLRDNIPNLAIRTTVLVGFPGETDADFNKLLQFMKDTRFERLGAFTYSNEEGSRSFYYEDQIPEDLKRERLKEIMELQQKISQDYNSSFLNRTIDVLIDEKQKNGNTYIGRTQFDAPSVDGEVFVKGRSLKPGDFVKAKITDTLEYDLVGEAV